jgi:hypothetical protein
VRLRVGSYNPRVTHELDARLADWEARLDRLEGSPATPEPKGWHLLFVSSPAGYELIECAGDAPSAGELLELEGREGRYTATRVVRSPLPGDERPCVYLEAI